MQEKDEGSMDRLIAELPASFTQLVRLQAVKEGKSIKQVLQEALELWLAQRDESAHIKAAQ